MPFLETFCAAALGAAVVRAAEALIQRWRARAGGATPFMHRAARDCDGMATVASFSETDDGHYATL